jgi:hypothetical protein
MDVFHNNNNSLEAKWVIPRQLDQAMTPMVTDRSDYFLQ